MAHALVTGGSSGIGRAVARRLVADGWRVTVTGRDRVRLADTAAELDCATVVADASREDDVARATATAAPFDCLVANAGTGVAARVSETDLADWRRILDVNLTGVWLHARAAFDVLRAAGGGSIVTIGSDVSLVGDPQIGAYSVSKAAVDALTRMLALDGAPHAIRCNCVCPGDVRPGMRDLGEDPASWPLPPLGRLGEATDVAGAVAYLASADAAWVTGATLVVDGGMRAGYGTGYFGGSA